MKWCGVLILRRRTWEKSEWSRISHNCWTNYLNLNIWDRILPVKLVGPIEHVHEGKNKWLKYYRPKFYDVLFYDMKQKHFVSDMKYFVVMIFIFSYTTYLVEKLLFHVLHKIKVSPPSTLYMKKLISITTKCFMSTSQSCKKNYWGNVEKRAIKVRNREILQ